jgi:CHAD domain-containing protein
VADGPPLSLELDLTLDPDDVRKLLRLFPAARGQTVSYKWHDTADGELAGQGLALVEQRQARTAVWRLEQLCPDGKTTWPCGTPAPVMQEAAHRAGLDGALPADPLHLVADFRGRSRQLTLREPMPARVALLQGRLRAKPGAQAVCRVTVAGSPPAVAALARDLALALRLSVAGASLAAEVRALAEKELPPVPLGAPELSPDLSVSAAFAFACAHLARVIQHYAPLAAAREGTEPVHQMRVAVRRLRSALALFRRAVACTEIDAAKAGLRVLGRALGPARDWDVFTEGTAQAVAAAFSGDAAIARVVAAATRRRNACYDELRHVLDSPEFRCLGITLATLAVARPWEAAQDGAAPHGSNAPLETLQEFAARALSRRLRHLTSHGDDISKLPDQTMHLIRLRAKRLRYGVEMLAPLYPRREARRYLRRLANLQDQLGHLNDGTVAAALMAELGRAGGRGFGAGVVCGFVAAGTGDARARIERSWRKFRRLQPFWA